MKLKKLAAIIAAATMVCSLAACGGKSNTVESKAQETEAEETMTVDKDKKEIVMLCEVNGTYFTEPTRHGIVYKGGSNGEKAVLRGLADEKEFYQALLDIGAKAGDNLTAADMKAGPDNGKSLNVQKTIPWICGLEEILRAPRKIIQDVCSVWTAVQLVL